MSGILGIINLDGKPISQELLWRMTDFMAYRGPDARQTWCDGHVGFGHALLRTTREAHAERQPFTSDGEVWITADARIDGRGDLFTKLKAKGSDGLEAAADAELILRAYLTWGEQCLEHLIGDFAFAIWDGRKRRLFCARDHMGVKPFYYAHVANSLILSNTLNCVRAHPSVSDELNDLAIADFLMFNFNQDLATTTFADIKRLPPANYLSWGGVTIESKRYWSLPAGGCIRYKRASDYIGHFRELLETAVQDRLRTDRVGISMSGGLDSTAVAATAKELLVRRNEQFDLRAHTVVYDRLIADEERYYARLAAEALHIPIHYLAADDYSAYERSRQPDMRRPEPVEEPLLAVFVDLLKQLATYSRVVLTGWDGDAVLNESTRSYFGALLKNRRFGRLAKDIGIYVLSRGELPQVGFRTWLRRLLGKPREHDSTYPSWINRAFAKRLNLPARWEEIKQKPSLSHPLRPDAYKALTLSTWSNLFESYDAGVTLFPIEFRHPLIDLRLVNYLLSIPTVPWFVNKELLRVAMHDHLPQSVLKRPKSPLAGNPVLESLRHRGADWAAQFDLAPNLDKYVDRQAIGQAAEDLEQYNLWSNIRPLSLNNWLQHLTPIKDESIKEGTNEYQYR